MTKTVLALAFLVVGSFSAAYAEEKGPMTTAVGEMRQQQNEERNFIMAHEAAIKELKQQMAANQPATTKQASIDYARYDRASRDCAGVGTWVPNPATKEHDAVAFNNQTDDGFKQFIMDCMAKRTAEDFAADARRAQKRVRYAQQQIDQQAPQNSTVPPAPGAIQDDQQAQPMTADLQGDGATPAPQQAAYYGNPMMTNGYRGNAQGRARCPAGFHFDPSAGACGRYTEVTGPTKYDVPDDVARCVPGTTRSIMVRGPFGPRKVDQVCRVHH